MDFLAPPHWMHTPSVCNWTYYYYTVGIVIARKLLNEIINPLNAAFILDCHLMLSHFILCHFVACTFMVTARSGIATMAHTKQLHLPAVVDYKATRLLTYWQEVAYRLVIFKWHMEFAQQYKYHHQSGTAGVWQVWHSLWKTFLNLQQRVYGF